MVWDGVHVKLNWRQILVEIIVVITCPSLLTLLVRIVLRCFSALDDPGFKWTWRVAGDMHFFQDHWVFNGSQTSTVAHKDIFQVMSKTGNFPSRQNNCLVNSRLVWICGANYFYCLYNNLISFISNELISYNNRVK